MKLKGKLQKEVLCIVAIAVWCALFQLGEIYDLCLFFFFFKCGKINVFNGCTLGYFDVPLIV